jgi:hypothetical protein
MGLVNSTGMATRRSQGRLAREDSIHPTHLPTYPHLDRPMEKPTLQEVGKLMEAVEDPVNHTLERMIPLERIFYSQDTIKSAFHDGSPLETKSIQPEWNMHVVDMDGEWFTLNNR